MENNKIFANGFIYKTPSPKAPEFIKANLSFKADEFIKFLQENDNGGWVNVDVKESKNGKIYGELNTWKKGDAGQNNPPSREDLKTIPKIDYPTEDIDPNDIPF